MANEKDFTLPHAGTLSFKQEKELLRLASVIKKIPAPTRAYLAYIHEVFSPGQSLAAIS